MSEEEKKAGRTPEDERRDGEEGESTQSAPKGSPHGAGTPGPVETKEEHEERIESGEGD